LCFNYDAGEPFGRVEISPWHDVPLQNADGTFNMIVEVPKWSRRKYEMATGELFNPIKIDVKNGKLREYAWGDSLFNYGAFPQTWEDPKHISPETNCGGDNDPLDVYDLGTRCWKVGEIVRVKVLGVVGLIDAGETDWKILAVSAEDPLAPLLNDIDDVDVHIPGAIVALMKWLKFYKAPVINEFAFDGEPKGRAFAEKVIKDTHLSWQALMTEKEGGSSQDSTSNSAPSIVSAGLRRSTSADKLSSLAF
jgi:inorganic pyrophosphatase